mmetsp:Transcript_70143/g.116512  ORF Transcript_70143/g.116512 Transcript_70143/m.116512 type:complete len:271 (-) Transcript_70143:509-1321(-)|eukprot:CAMPEP_0119344522 /NCGR_PEP_ID=MMETSP1333-20130426/107014_1 /TAXON_ID=418940 /ORGANISM="Scyphosphaera apsteinii, Strain RCC1455" /LENGTH=270 /DNA_ID=CAMNT_0007356961 /DNA_START=14 /DNA_END=826 /DNA_ORIENTATION=-
MKASVACQALIFVLAGNANAQLRPRRVGLSSLGEQEAPAEAGIDDVGEAGVKDAAQQLQEAALKLKEQMDPEALKNAMLQNPLLQGLSEANPEVAEMLSDPEKLKGKMEEVATLLSTDEGKETMSNMASMMQSVLSDPEKMRQGLEQFASNPMFSSMADAMPELKEVLDNPELMEKSINEISESLKGMDASQGDFDPAKLMEMFTGGADSLPGMMPNAADSAGVGLDSFANGGGDASLKQRVREQLASVLGNRGGEKGMGGLGDLDAEEF